MTVSALNHLLENRFINGAATTLSLALTAFDASYLFSATQPVLFCMGAAAGVAASAIFEEGLERPIGRERAPTPILNNRRAKYSLIVGALPTPLTQISSFAADYFSIPVVFGFRCGAMACHGYNHLKALRRE